MRHLDVAGSSSSTSPPSGGLAPDSRHTNAHIYLIRTNTVCQFKHFHEQDFSLIKTQLALDEFLKGCNGVAGHVGHGGMESEGLGKAKGGIGGIGQAYKEQHVGTVEI